VQLTLRFVALQSIARRSCRTPLSSANLSQRLANEGGKGPLHRSFRARPFGSANRAEAHREWGWGIGAGIATALILGAIYRHHYRPYYYGYPYYSG
jgi:hypothetical protein